MVSGDEQLMRILAQMAKIEHEYEKRILWNTSTISRTLLYEYVCRPNQMTPIPWEHWLFYLGLRLRVVTLPNETRSVEIKPFG